MNNNLDQQFMLRALELAQRAPITAVKSNPRVGAIIVKHGKMIGEGYYKEFGGPHAEINALRSCRVSPHGAIMYVTLEPHCFYGKTPPCTDVIIKADIRRVICAMKDPNPFVNGKGIEVLRQKGIRVEIYSPLVRGVRRQRDGVCSCLQEAEQLNETYLYFQKTSRPFIAIKIASSLDGKIAIGTGDSKWITSQEARDYARTKIRSEYQAILVGVNTVLQDDPHLGIQKKRVPDPLRIILDSRLRTALNAKVLRNKNIILAVGSAAPQSRIQTFEKKGFTLWFFPSRHISIPQLLKKLAENKITSVLVEGGGETVGAFLDARAVQKVYWFHAPLIIGGNESKSSVGGIGVQTISQALSLTNINRIPLGRDLLTIGYLS